MRCCKARNHVKHLDRRVLWHCGVVNPATPVCDDEHDRERPREIDLVDRIDLVTERDGGVNKSKQKRFHCMSKMCDSTQCAFGKSSTDSFSQHLVKITLTGAGKIALTGVAY